VTDPPYGLAFMGKDWDHGVPGVPFWRAVLRVLKPGGHLLAFGGTRTHHRLVSAIEDAGWEIRDTIMWVYGSGFPKSLDVSKAIDKAAGAEREVVGPNPNNRPNCAGKQTRSMSAPITVQPITAPATDAAKQWQGWGTALKPAQEPICLARKPLDNCTVAANVLRHGTGGINVDGCRIGTEDNLNGGGYSGGDPTGMWREGAGGGLKRLPGQFKQPQGRWPSNVIHDGSDEVVGMLDEQSGHIPPGKWNRTKGARPFNNQGKPTEAVEWKQVGDSGGASRFFYCAKASRAERESGCEGLPQACAPKTGAGKRITVGRSKDIALPRGNHHPTVKPVALMRYLCRLITPPGGTVLDPFMGSGSTGMGCAKEGFRFVGVELDAEYFDIACRRIEAAMTGGPLLAGNEP